MQWVNTDYLVPIKSWCAVVDNEAMAQARHLAEHPVVRKIALMPDCHAGYGMPVGGVIACAAAVIPNAVGVDIGCGMCAVKTSLPAEEANEVLIREVIEELRREIPVGFKHHKTPRPWAGFDEAPDDPVIQGQIHAARKQIGTLGGGNHFIELQAGDDGFVWLMLHSGSRNFGYQIANYYNMLARTFCERWCSIAHRDLAFLPMGESEADNYIAAMKYAQDFAAANRAMMMGTFRRIMNVKTQCVFEDEINIHHNFAEMENHNGHNYWVHRKGATQARDGQLGIIPGSMGTSSYIVRGRGNPDSLKSCSHGAGRRMGRGQFNRTTTVEEADKQIEGVVFSGWGKNRRGGLDLSEAPGAYKDIDEVIAAQTDLVEVLVKLRPLGVLKG